MENNDAERVSSFFRFEDLRIYHKSLDYSTWVHANTKQFTAEMQDNLTTQFLRASHAIAVNIAEGSARNKSQFIYYLKMAKSAVRECVVYTAVSTNLKLFKENQTEESRNHLMELTKMIGALVASLQRSTLASEGGERNSERENHDDDE